MVVHCSQFSTDEVVEQLDQIQHGYAAGGRIPCKSNALIKTATFALSLRNTSVATRTVEEDDSQH